MDLLREATDEAMMARCIELSRDAIGQGEYPFGTVIAAGGQIVAEAVDRTIREGDVTCHAEVIALSIAQKALGRRALREATLYSNVEPCVMCSYCIREAWIGRVVFALGSPVMGGLSKWNILRTPASPIGFRFLRHHPKWSRVCFRPRHSEPGGIGILLPGNSRN